ncbi:hypothetical protein TSOC_010252 [Tetrabaena socialis]|uniref:Uncharacterized protein n=1 Tax=Tetrabaena socialis TaxID=47790 RepID=A0A2J7ZTS6_9CHLO|nr:hypothetical protein TSOC_010252 [Tetrabaena socialis]|eukprot:PNH03675.1 hypothetical protein TSOC_010252 [Tetrabaena socialis]
MLARGCRPRVLKLWFGKGPAAASAALGSSILAQFAAVPSLSVAELSLARLPLTEQIQLELSPLKVPASSSDLSTALAALASSLQHCSRLESLTLVLRDSKKRPVSWLPDTSAMRGLVQLDVRCMELLPPHLQQLAALTALTQLRVGSVQSAVAAAGAGGMAGPSPVDSAGLPLLPLPPRLGTLTIDEHMDAAVLAALQLPVCLTRLELPGVTLCDGASYGGGNLPPAAAEVLLVACRQLSGRYHHSTQPQLQLPFRVDLGRASPPPSWQGLYGPLFAALQPAGLEQLILSYPPLSVLGVDALVRHLPLLQVLVLPCGLELASLPFLRCLARLRKLWVGLGGSHGDVGETWGNVAALKGALLVLCKEAPSLKSAMLDLEGWGASAIALEAALAWLDVTLTGLRGRHPVVKVVGADPRSSSSSSSSSGEEL